VKESARFNAVMVGIKLVVLAFFVYVSFHFVKSANWRPFAPNGFAGISTGAAIIFFAYIGFDAVSTTAEECRNPKRDMPIGIIGSLIVCTVIYAIVAAVFTGMVPFPVLLHLNSSQQAEPLTMAMKYVHMPNYMVGIVALGSVIAHTAVLLVFQLGQPRILFAMARDGFLPPSFAKVHPKFHAARGDDPDGVLVGSRGGGQHRRNGRPDEHRRSSRSSWSAGDHGAPLQGPWCELRSVRSDRCSCRASASSQACTSSSSFPSSWWRFFGWLLAGLVVYFLYGFRHSRLRNGPGRERSTGFDPAARQRILVGSFHSPFVGESRLRFLHLTWGLPQATNRPASLAASALRASGFI
jgi:APA family basic amino acid/polyamine antiporter